LSTLFKQLPAEISGNDVVTDAAVSARAPLTRAPRLHPPRGHPASLKVAGAEAARLTIADNRVRMWGEPTAVRIMPGLVNADADLRIRGNHCSMGGQFAGLPGG
jgi:hypothetical protein